MFSALYHLPEQIAEGMSIGKQITIKHHNSELKNIVFAGMGGSAIAGDIAISLCNNATVPMTTVRNYTLPSWVNTHTTVILLSYSGNTEETIACMHQALNKGATVIGITSGGIIKDTLTTLNGDVITIPGGMMPRAAIGYLAIPLLYILDELNQIDSTFEQQLKNLILNLKQHRKTLSDSTAQDNIAFSTAQQILSATPRIYAASNATATIAKRWRAQLAENSKLLSSTHALPELNHNEIVSWQNTKRSAHRYGIIWITDSSMHTRNKKRFDITHNMAKDHVAYQKAIDCTGESLIERTFYALYIGDWVSYWAAILQHIDPTPINNIEYLKKHMSQE